MSMPKSEAKNLSNKTSAILTVVTPLASVTFINEAVSNLSSKGTKTVDEKAGMGTVAILVNHDGSETIIKKSIPANGTLAFALNGSATIRIKDNSKAFPDAEGHWATDSIQFVTGRELFNGVSETSFAPNSPMTCAMLVTVLHRLEDLSAGGTLAFSDTAAGLWYSDAVAWASDIADRLNESGILTPMDYKKSLGMRYSTAFRSKSESVWSAGMILRILKNPVYIGTLEQGRVTTPSYKVKRLVQKPQEEWAIIPNNHKAIIDYYDFESVQRVLALDSRTSVSGKAVECFSGIVFCGECGASMIRETVPSGRKKYVYYVCTAHKNEKTCTTHSIRDTLLNEIVLELVKQRIQDVLNLSELFQLIDMAQLQQANGKKIQERLDKKKEEIGRNRKLLQSLYESLADGIINQQEYQDLKKTYTRRCAETEAQAEILYREMSEKIDWMKNSDWIEQFRKHQGISALDRSIVVSLIERILIYRAHRVEVVFRWNNEYNYLTDLLSQTLRLQSARGVD